MREIKLYKRSVKFLKRLPYKQQQQILRQVTALQTNVRPADYKKLIGYQKYYRIDSGEYRIVYWWDEFLVHVIIVGKRNDSEVYRKLKHLT